METFDPEGRLRYTIEQHEDLNSEELIGIVKAVANPRLGLLFDFGNMINAYELPLPALSAQAPYVTEVHVKDCLVQQDRDGWAHLAFGTQIALLHRGKPVLGMINQPITGERWFGIGSSATLNHEPIRTSEKTALGEAILYTSALEQFDRARHERLTP